MLPVYQIEPDAPYLGNARRMAELTPEIAAQVVEACKAGADEAAEALSRALDAKITLSVGEPGSVDVDALPEELSQPGLAVVLTVGEAAAVLLLPTSSGLVPEWCADPDPTGQSKLATLGQELGMLLLPEEFVSDDFKAGVVKNLSGAIRRGGVASGAAMVPLELESDGNKAVAQFIWPVPKPGAVVGLPAPKPEPAEKKPPAKPTPAPPKPVDETRKKPRRVKVKDLPNYTRSLLRIKVPVVVKLAEKRQPLGRAIELCPGTIIQFEKSCEDMLEMNVGELPIATGEAVKVGDKFGLRITSIILPEERFSAVKPTGK